MNLFLDDLRSPKDVAKYCSPELLSTYTNTTWTIVRNYDEFINHIQEYGIPNICSLDHDLADEHYCPEIHYITGWDKWAETQEFKEKTGYECAKWLIEYAEENNLDLPPHIMCHSMNPVGKEKILSLFESYKKYKEKPEPTKPSIEPVKVEQREGESLMDAVRRHLEEVYQKSINTKINDSGL